MVKCKLNILKFLSSFKIVLSESKSQTDLDSQDATAMVARELALYNAEKGEVDNLRNMLGKMRFQPEQIEQHMTH